jgi:hypothetical protein
VIFAAIVHKDLSSRHIKNERKNRFNRINFLNVDGQEC